MTKSYRVTVAVAALMALSGCGIFKGSVKKTPTVGDRVSILTSENGVETDATIADVQVLLPAPAVNDAWAQPGGNPAKSMGQLALGAQLNRAWQATINGGSNRERMAASPVVGENKLFAMDVGGMAHAYAADTGAALWTVSITGAASMSDRLDTDVVIDVRDSASCQRMRPFS